MNSVATTTLVSGNNTTKKDATDMSFSEEGENKNNSNFTEAEISQNAEINARERAHNLAIRGATEEPPPLPTSLPPPLPTKLPPGMEEDEIVGDPPSYADCTEATLHEALTWDLSDTKVYKKLEEFGVDCNKKREPKIGGLYQLVTIPRHVDKENFETHIRGLGLGTLPPRETDDPKLRFHIAHETITKDGKYFPHTHALVPYLEFTEMRIKRKNPYAFMGVLKPHIRMVATCLDAVIKYLHKEDKLSAKEVVGVGEEKMTVWVEKPAVFPSGVLKDMFQWQLWMGLLKKTWENGLYWIKDDVGGMARRLLIAEFAKVRPTWIVSKIPGADKIDRFVKDALKVDQLSIVHGEVRYVFICMDDEFTWRKCSNIEEITKAYQVAEKEFRVNRYQFLAGLLTGTFNGIGFQIPRVVVFSRSFPSMDTRGGVMELSDREALNEIPKEMWKLGSVVWKEEMRVLDWQSAYVVEEEVKEVVEEGVIKVPEVLSKMIDEVKWVSYDTEGEKKEEKEKKIGMNDWQVGGAGESYDKRMKNLWKSNPTIAIHIEATEASKALSNVFK